MLSLIRFTRFMGYREMTMTTQHKTHTLTWYRIKVKGHLGSRWSGWFEDMTISSSSGETILTGPVADQAALHGLLIRIRDLNLTLLSLKCLTPEPENKK